MDSMAENFMPTIPLTTFHSRMIHSFCHAGVTLFCCDPCFRDPIG